MKPHLFELASIACILFVSCSAVPTITTPRFRSISAGQTASFHIKASGNDLRYQWRKNGTNIPGATEPSYTTPVTAAGDSGAVFSCVVSNTAGSVTSKAAILSVGPAPEGTVTDIDGNLYHSVVIGTQEWMVENLKTTRCYDGTVIQLVTDSAAWSNLRTPGCCWYSNDASASKATYGALYNWSAVNTGKLAPTGWHVPTDAEWTILANYLGGEAAAGGKLKKADTSWTSCNTGATNETGFSALPGGFRNIHGAFYSVAAIGYWWSATAKGPASSWCRVMSANSPVMKRMIASNVSGFSVRCLRD